MRWHSLTTPTQMERYESAETPIREALIKVSHLRQEYVSKKVWCKMLNLPAHPLPYMGMFLRKFMRFEQNHVNFPKNSVKLWDICSGGSKEGREGRVLTPAQVQILSISCSFWENLAKSYVGAPPGKLAPPPRGNPGSATEKVRQASCRGKGRGRRGFRILHRISKRD